MYKYDDDGFEIKASYEKFKEVLDRTFDPYSKPDRIEDDTLAYVNEDWATTLSLSQNKVYVYVMGLELADSVIEINAEDKSSHFSNQECFERYIARYLEQRYNERTDI